MIKKATKTLTRELYGGEWYEYVPLGKHVVAAPGVCGGRPTFKYTRLEVSVILDLLAAGWSVQKILRNYSHSRISAAAIKEAVHLAKETLLNNTRKLKTAA
ncbi:DUF433 domain-containing protein [candidate division KSB1 bacterium]|nr:DUF433 domain-containing protein [candidate division KSB1 bacterium]